MTIAQTLKNMANVQLMRRRVTFSKRRMNDLEVRVQQLNHLIKDDILSLIDRQATYRGTLYQSYKAAVEEINKKYNGTAD